MRSFLGVVGLFAISGAVAACSGSDGAAGPAGAAGAAGAKGDPGAGGTPAAGFVVPHFGLLARDMDVTVTGEGLAFDPAKAPTLDFGAGITVSNIMVVSPNAVIAHLKIDAAAAIGPRDVKIGAGASNVVAAKDFDVEAPLGLSVAAGKAEQGGIAVLRIKNRDVTTALTSSFLYLTKGSAVWTPIDATATDIDLAIVVDPLFPVGAMPFNLANPALDGTPGISFLADPTALMVTARTPTTLTSGTAKADSLAQVASSNSYKLSTTGAAIVSLVTTYDAANQPLTAKLRVYGAKGTTDDLLDEQAGFATGFFGPGTPPSSTVFPVAAAEDAYIVLADAALGGGTGFDYTLTPAVTPVANVVAEGATAHATPATATDVNAKCITAGPCVITGKISAAQEFDLYKITIAATDKIGLSFRHNSDSAILIVAANAAGTALDLTTVGVVAPSIINVSAPSFVGSSTSTPGAPPNGPSWYVVVLGQTGGKKPTGDYTFSITKG